MPLLAIYMLAYSMLCPCKHLLSAQSRMPLLRYAVPAAHCSSPAKIFRALCLAASALLRHAVLLHALICLSMLCLCMLCLCMLCLYVCATQHAQLCPMYTYELTQVLISRDMFMNVLSSTLQQQGSGIMAYAF